LKVDGEDDNDVDDDDVHDEDVDFDLFDKKEAQGGRQSEAKGGGCQAELGMSLSSGAGNAAIGGGARAPFCFSTRLER
jgi:hypothetical protein